jgi:hypothetical protein
MKLAPSLMKHLQDGPLLMSGDVARSERHYLPLAFFGAGGGSAASRASRSALRRSRFLCPCRVRVLSQCRFCIAIAKGLASFTLLFRKGLTWFELSGRFTHFLLPRQQS